jgi:hypothetical protein
VPYRVTAAGKKLRILLLSSVKCGLPATLYKTWYAFSATSEAKPAVVWLVCVGLEPGWEDKGLCLFGLLHDKRSTYDTDFMERLILYQQQP